MFLINLFASNNFFSFKKNIVYINKYISHITIHQLAYKHHEYIFFTIINEQKNL